jgi:hypothetical protein
LFRREAATLETFGIDAMRFGGPPYRHNERRHIASHRGVVGDEGMSTHGTELMHAGKTAHVHPIPDLHVTAQGCVVCKYAVRTDIAVVTNMRPGHE